MKQVLLDAGKDFADIVLSYLRKDKEQMDIMLGSKKRIFMFNEFDGDGGARNQNQQSMQDGLDSTDLEIPYPLFAPIASVDR